MNLENCHGKPLLAKRLRALFFYKVINKIETFWVFNNIKCIVNKYSNTNQKEETIKSFQQSFDCETIKTRDLS